MKPILSVRDLGVCLEGRMILRQLNFDVAEADTLAIIGPNGAGKTVLLRALLDLVPYSGTIRWAEGTQLGYVPQKIAADRQLPVEARDLLAAKAHILKLGEAAITEVAETVELPRELLTTSIGVLSGGQFQKLLIAFALLGGPNVLLFDEPTASLDELSEERVYSLLAELQRRRGMTILLVSHDLSVVYQAANKVLCLSGDTVCFGAPREILTPETLASVYSASATSFYRHHQQHGSMRNE
jgi:zinc transport system ATP-binding protein